PRAQHPQMRAQGFIDALAAQPWPGNVRELRNYLERQVALRGEAFDPPPGGELPLPDVSQPLKRAREQWNRSLERKYLAEMLKRHNGNAAAAARAAGVGRIYFYRRLWMHGLR